MVDSKSLSLSFVPVRIQRSATILLDDLIEKVFPLFGPVREMEWADGWAPEILYGSNEAEAHMIFRTRSHECAEEYYQWVIGNYDPFNYSIEYIVSSPGRVWFITVHCTARENQTLATITYSYCGLTEDGHRDNRFAMEKMFASNLSDWEHAINYYLKTGKKLKT